MQLQAATIHCHKNLEHLQPRPAAFNAPMKSRSKGMLLQVAATCCSHVVTCTQLSLLSLFETSVSLGAEHVDRGEARPR